jgi:adenine/guanine phosphoribosyltransferase-like PRPP-binding protein
MYQVRIQPYREGAPGREFTAEYPVRLSCRGRPVAEMILPIRPLPDGQSAISLLMTSQLGFHDLDFLSDLLADHISHLHPHAIIGMPTLGLPVAERVARRLGHTDYVPLSLSGKFWQADGLTTHIGSVTSTDIKKLAFDQYLVERLGEDQPLVIVDDVVCRGTSLEGAFLLVGRRINQYAGRPVVNLDKLFMATLLTEAREWQVRLEKAGFDWKHKLFNLGKIPMFSRKEEGIWVPAPGTE